MAEEPGLDELRRRLEEIERRLERQRRWGRVKLAVTILLVAGVAAYLVSLYGSMAGWRVELADTPRIGMRSPTQLDVTIPVRIYNPDGRVTARLVYYEVYVAGEYAGQGLIPYLDLPSGWSVHRLHVVVDLTGLSCGAAEALSRGDKVPVTVNGTAMVDLRVFGVIPWRSVTVPFSFTAEVEAPPTGPARDALALYAYACTHYRELLRMLQGLLRGGGLGLP